MTNQYVISTSNHRIRFQMMELAPAVAVASGTRSILIREAAMPTCETCGNDYDKAFQVTLNGTTHTFDSFECAIQSLAPSCPHCGTHVVGHGVEKDRHDLLLCSLRQQEGVTQLRDRA
jgi:hypothetical protein